MHLCWLRLRYSRVTTHGTVELIVEKFSEFRVCFPYFEGGCICRYNDQFVINQIDRCCTDPITGIAAWRTCRYNLRWAINPAGHSPRHTNKVLELVSKLVVHSSIRSELNGSSAVECRTRNLVSPVRIPLCYRFEDWAFSFSSLTPLLVQLYK